MEGLAESAEMVYSVPPDGMVFVLADWYEHSLIEEAAGQHGHLINQSPRQYLPMLGLEIGLPEELNPRPTNQATDMVELV